MFLMLLTSVKFHDLRFEKRIDSKPLQKLLSLLKLAALNQLNKGSCCLICILCFFLTLRLS